MNARRQRVRGARADVGDVCSRIALRDDAPRRSARVSGASAVKVLAGWLTNRSCRSLRSRRPLWPRRPRIPRRPLRTLRARRSSRSGRADGARRPGHSLGTWGPRRTGWATGQIIATEAEVRYYVTSLTPEQADTLTALDEALAQLAELDPRRAQVVECRFFGGMSIPDTAAALGTSPATVKREWAQARAWLYRALQTRSEA